MSGTKPITLCELSPFQKYASKYWSDDELFEFKWHLARHPKAGDRVRGAGGVRKVRWGRGNRGKSGGVRVIYYYQNPGKPIYLITLFAKSNKLSLTDAQKQRIKQLVKQLP